MISNQKKYWENIYSNKALKFPQYDHWLEKYLPLLNNKKILDLGCGNGVDSLFLYQNGINTIACDISENALNLIKEELPNCETVCFDMTTDFPFDNNFFDIIIADLSLHYFDKQTTIDVIERVKLHLKNDGHFLCRLNSTSEYRKNISDVELDKNFYLINGHEKRFFDTNDIDFFFRNWNIEHQSLDTTNKYWEKNICGNYIYKRG